MSRFAALALLLLLPRLGQAGPIEVIGHRGAPQDAPENTVASFREAWRQGADAAELDVHLTKDGKLVVIHDASTKRTTGVDLKVAERTLEELRKLDAGGWKGGRFRGEKLPTLAEMLATAPEGKRVFVEVKCGPEAVPELVRALKASGLKPAQTPVISFDPRVIAAVKQARPEVPAYWLVSLRAGKGKEPPSAEGLVATALKIKADGLDLSASEALDAAFARKVKAAGLSLYVWTVNDEKVARRLAGLGVDGITTDRPGWLRERLGKAGTAPPRAGEGADGPAAAAPRPPRSRLATGLPLPASLPRAEVLEGRAVPRSGDRRDQEGKEGPPGGFCGPPGQARGQHGCSQEPRKGSRRPWAAWAKLAWPYRAPGRSAGWASWAGCVDDPGWGLPSAARHTSKSSPCPRSPTRNTGVAQTGSGEGSEGGAGSACVPRTESGSGKDSQGA